MDWELVEQLRLQAPVVLDRDPKNCSSKSPIRLQLETGVNGQVARMSSLGKDWSGSRMAPKPRGGWGRGLEAGKRIRRGLQTLMQPFSTLRSGPSWSVLRLCLRETAWKSL